MVNIRIQGVFNTIKNPQINKLIREDEITSRLCDVVHFETENFIKISLQKAFQNRFTLYETPEYKFVSFSTKNREIS